MNLINQTVDQYQIVAPINETLYHAYQPWREEDVILKIFPLKKALTISQKTMLMRRAKAIAALKHPNILPLYDVGFSDTLCYYVMKYIPTQTLQNLLGTPLHLCKVNNFIEQLASVLDYAHSRQVIHTNLRPQNILFEKEWLYLTDFGLEKTLQDQDIISIPNDVPPYLSPEQAEGHPVDHRTDIYSLGVILYEMVVGEVPYQALTPLGVLFKHIYGPLPRPRRFNPGLPIGVEKIIRKAMAKEPFDRYDQAGELAEVLRFQLALSSNF